MMRGVVNAEKREAGLRKTLCGAGNVEQNCTGGTLLRFHPLSVKNVLNLKNLIKMIKIGRIYAPKDPTKCGTFAAEKGATYVRYYNKNNYELLDKNLNNMRSTCNCFEEEELHELFTLEAIQEGDLLIDGDDLAKLVLGRAGRIVFLANHNKEPDGKCGCLNQFTIQELTDFHYRFADAPETTEELTMEQVCKELGRTVKIIKK
jgi:hypothetical protein